MVRRKGWPPTARRRGLWCKTLGQGMQKACQCTGLAQMLDFGHELKNSSQGLHYYGAYRRVFAPELCKYTGRLPVVCQAPPSKSRPQFRFSVFRFAALRFAMPGTLPFPIEPAAVPFLVSSFPRFRGLLCLGLPVPGTCSLLVRCARHVFRPFPPTSEAGRTDVRWASGQSRHTP